jgi:hypothetical protein
MEIAIMIEGQNGLNWIRWQRLVKAVEELGFFAKRTGKQKRYAVRS